MTKPVESRIGAIEAYQTAGRGSFAVIKAFYKCSARSVYRWRSRLLMGEPIKPKRKRIAKAWSCVEPLHLQHVLQLLEIRPMAYLKEMVEHVFTRFGWRYSKRQVSSALQKEGVTHKVLEFRALEQARNERLIYRTAIARFNPHQLVFLDETHAKPNDLRRTYGYGYRGQPAFVAVRNAAHGQGTASSGICAISLEGELAITVTTENINGDFFLANLRDRVLPNMNAFPMDNSVLIMDNAPTHDHIAVIALCQQFQVIPIFLPRYSYDYNPIELAFHEAKAYIRREYGLADGNVSQRLYEGLASVTVPNIESYYRKCGYLM